MIKSLLAATAALTLMAGGAFAQSSSAASSTFQQTSRYAPPTAVVPMADRIDDGTQRDFHGGVVSDRDRMMRSHETIEHPGDTTRQDYRGGISNGTDR